MACAAALALAASAQGPGAAGGGLALELRSGETVAATALRGTPEQGYTATLGRRGEREIETDELIAVRAGPARAVELLRVELAGGDVVYGALTGGDAQGYQLELQSPVLDRVSLPVDRIAAVVQPGVHPADQQLPDGVDEGVFVPTARGYDLVAGTLHRFGPQGVRFQPEAADAPRWYAPNKFSSLRLRGAFAREQPAPCLLWTRTGDRLGVGVRAFTADGVELELEGERRAFVRWADVGCLVWSRGVVHLSTLDPVAVEERGYDGDVVHPWRRDRCAAGGGPLLVQGSAYGRGIGAHSRSRLVFAVPAGATHFRARVAFDDSAAALPVRAHAEVRVLRDDEVLFEADDLRPGQAPRDVGLHAVAAGQQIVLEVDFGEGRDLGDRVDWLLPLFLMRSGS